MPILGTRAGASVNGYGMFGKAFPTAVVTGGTLSSDATYFYRTFTANGTLSVTNGTVSADYALIAGGGGGGASIYVDFGDGTGWGQIFYGGPGGAGGYQNANAQNLSGSYSIVIGDGGSRGIYTGGIAPSAGSSTTGFGLTAAGGGAGAATFTVNGGNGGCGGGAYGQYGTKDGPPGATGTGGTGSQGGNGTSGYPGAAGGSGTTPGTAGNSGVNIFSLGTTYGIGGGNRGGNTADGGTYGTPTITRFSGTNSADGSVGAKGIVIVRYLKSAVS